MEIYYDLDISYYGSGRTKNNFNLLNENELTIENCVSILKKDINQIIYLPSTMVVNEQFWLTLKDKKIYPDLEKVSLLKKVDFLFISKEFNFDYYLPFYNSRIEENIGGKPLTIGFYATSTFSKDFLSTLSKNFLLELVKNNPFTLLKLKNYALDIDLNIMACYVLPEILLLLDSNFRTNNKLITSALRSPPNLLKNWLYTKKESYLQKLIPDFEETSSKQQKRSFITTFYNNTGGLDLYDLAIRFGDIHAIKYVEPESVLHYVKNYIVQYPELAQYLSGYSEYVVMNVIMDNKEAVEFLPDDLKKSFSQQEELIRIRNSLTKFENSNENNLEILKGLSAIKKELMMLTNHNDKNQLLEI